MDELLDLLRVIAWPLVVAGAVRSLRIAVNTTVAAIVAYKATGRGRSE
jgi:hypothetical protein